MARARSRDRGFVQPLGINYVRVKFIKIKHWARVINLRVKIYAKNVKMYATERFSKRSYICREIERVNCSFAT